MFGRLLVGAPRANSSHQPGLLEPGAVLSCPTDPGQQGALCTQLKLDDQGQWKGPGARTEGNGGMGGCAGAGGRAGEKVVWDGVRQSRLELGQDRVAEGGLSKAGKNQKKAGRAGRGGAGGGRRRGQWASRVA